MALWQKYRTISPRTRIFIGLGVMSYAGLGLFLSDKAEERFGLVPSEKDKQELDRYIPTITIADRGEVSKGR